MKICYKNCIKCIHFYPYIRRLGGFDDAIYNYCEVLDTQLFEVGVPSFKISNKYWSQFDCSEFEKDEK